MEGDTGDGSELLLAVSVLQIEMRIEVDEDLLTRFRGCYHPETLLRGRVGTGVARGGQVARGVDVYVPPAFICTENTRKEDTGESRCQQGWREEPHVDHLSPEEENISIFDLK